MKLIIKRNQTSLLLFFILSLGLYYIFFNYIDNFSQSQIVICKFILCWIGIFELVYIIATWYKAKKNIFSLYLLFIVFFFLFNFGQCFMWAFGVHTTTEIGSMKLFYKLSVPTDFEIVKTQLIVLVSAAMIHIGAMFPIKLKKNEIIQKDKNILIKRNERTKESLYLFCKIIFPIVVFSEFYYQINNIINASSYGYTGLYYNTNVQNISVVFQIFARLFFPVLIGLLLSSGYKKRTIIFVYCTFAIDVFLSIFVGDRGGWLYSLIILLICHYKYYRKPNFRQIFLIGISGYLMMVVLIAVKKIRNMGVTVNGIIGTLSAALVSPFIETLNEMGGTMGITTALVMQGWNIFPYGNSFLYGILIAPSKRIISLLNLNFESVSSWFSQSYLNISNGVAFSIVGETLMNFGPVFLPIFMIAFGIVIYKITNIEDYDKDENVLIIFYKIITTSVIINISRNCFSYNLGEIIYTTILFFILYTIFITIFRRKVRYYEK